MTDADTDIDNITVGVEFDAERHSGAVQLTHFKCRFVVRKITKADIYWCDAVGGKMVREDGRVLTHNHRVGCRFKVMGGLLTQIVPKYDTPGWRQIRSQ